MFKRLLQSLALDYEFVAMGRQVLSKEEMDVIVRGDRTKVQHAGKVLVPVGAAPTREDMVDLDECAIIVDHVQEMAEWIDQLGRSEII